MGKFEKGGIYLGAFCDKMKYSHSASRSENYFILYERNVFFLLHVDQAHVLILFQAASLKIYITNPVLASIHFVNLFPTQFAQFNKTTKWQDILRLCLGDIAKTQFILKSDQARFRFWWSVCCFNVFDYLSTLKHSVIILFWITQCSFTFSRIVL